ncbi:MAG: HPF/RaiA family ribosome-associated protein [Bacteroides sp.]
MGEMQVRYDVQGMEISEHELKKVERKLEKLQRFSATSVSVVVRKLEELAGSLRVEIRVNANGDFYASKEGSTVEDAIDGAVDALVHQLEKRAGRRV